MLVGYFGFFVTGRRVASTDLEIPPRFDLTSSRPADGSPVQNCSRHAGTSSGRPAPGNRQVSLPSKPRPRHGVRRRLPRPTWRPLVPSQNKDRPVSRAAFVPALGYPARGPTTSAGGRRWMSRQSFPRSSRELSSWLRMGFALRQRSIDAPLGWGLSVSDCTSVFPIDR
jgi:hypothetical protein